MGVLTPFFNLFKPAKNDPAAILQINNDLDIIDTEMHKPPLTVNETEPDEDRNITITTVPLADNLTNDEAQINTGTFIIRTSGGEASISNGAAWLSTIRGNQVKTGVVEESLTMTVTPAQREEGVEPITATIDRDTFVAYVGSSGTVTLTYATAWSADPALYGITVTGTPISGDQIKVVYVKANRGTITTANPSSFVSTGWNLYNHAAGYARVVNYSQEYGFMIDGTYTGLAFAETLSGTQTTITPVDGYFTVPSDGYVFVTGGNDTDTEIWMTWSDWIDEPNEGTFAAYSQTSIDLSGVMVDFPDGLMRIGNYYDEIDLNTQRAYSRIEKLQYTTENLEGVIASGVPYDTDENYIYAVRTDPATYTISVSGEYTVSDHGEEIFIGTSVPVTASALYGNDLKGKLRRDVVTISQQTLTSAQQAQIRTNIGAVSQADIDATNTAVSKILPIITGTNNNSGYSISSGEYFEANGDLYKATASIPTGSAWSSSATLQSDNGAINALNTNITDLKTTINGRTVYYNVSNSNHTFTFGGKAGRRCVAGLITIASPSTIYKPVAFGFTGSASGTGDITGTMVESNDLNITASGYTITVPKQENNNYGRIGLIYFYDISNLTVEYT